MWGDVSLLEAHLGCAGALLKTPVKWRYLINFAASAFPLKSVEEMVFIGRRVHSITSKVLLKAISSLFYDFYF